MLLTLVAVAVVGGLVTLIFFTMLALTSARSLQRSVAGAQAQLMPAVEEILARGQEIAKRAQHLLPQL